MRHSYRRQLLQTMDWVLPALGKDDAFDARERWAWFPLAFVWLFQVFSRCPTLGERFDDARGWLRKLLPTTPLADTYQGYVKAMRKRGDALVAKCRAAFQTRLWDWLGDDDLVAGWRPIAVDGTRFDCPRSRQCQRAFGSAAREKSAPQLVLTSLWHLSVHCWCDGRIASATVGERTLLRQMLNDLPPRTLLVGDAGLIGYDLCLDLMMRGVSFLFRVGANVSLLTDLGGYHVTGNTVYLWPHSCHSQPPMMLRLIMVGTGKRKVYLVTDVLSPCSLSKRQAAFFYRCRWGVETAYRSMKQTLDRHTLRSRSSDLALWELFGAWMGAWALSLISLKARGRRAWKRVWSVAQSARIIRAALNRSHHRGPSLIQRLQAQIITPSKRRKKTRQVWPRKKHEPPCGAPNITRATNALIREAQRFMHPTQ